MYGIINNTIREMVIEIKDEATWQSICNELNLEFNMFEAFQQYDDNVTLNLVLTISKALSVEVNDLLEAFGEFFVKFFKNSEYSAILKASATGPLELIESLDALHSRLELIFDDLNAPSFWSTKVKEGELIIFYNSSRDLPLEAFVIGLLKGIFKMFDYSAVVTQIDHDEEAKAIFKVIYVPPSK